MPGSFLTCVISMMDSMDTGSPALMELLVACKSPHKAWFERGRTSSLSSLKNVSKMSTNNLLRSLSVKPWCILECPNICAWLLFKLAQLFRGWMSTINLRIVSSPERFLDLRYCLNLLAQGLTPITWSTVAAEMSSFTPISYRSSSKVWGGEGAWN